MIIDRTRMVELLYEGMSTDGAHHKQWALAQLAKLSMTAEEYKSFREWFVDDYSDDFDEGIVP